MQRIISAVATALLFGLLPSGPVAAEPSFACTGTLNLTERTICRDVLLGDLDRRMVRYYSARRDRVRGDEGRKLVAEQRLWLGWRNTCGDDGGCLRRRYEQRIIDLAGARALPPGFGSGGVASAPQRAGGQAPERRLRNGRYERVYPDGRIEWESINGGSFGTDFPNGDGTVMMKSQSAPPSFPALPDQYSAWGVSLEIGLLGLIDSLLSEADRAAYRDLQNGFPYSDRILRHVQAVGFLMEH